MYLVLTNVLRVLVLMVTALPVIEIFTGIQGPVPVLVDSLTIQSMIVVFVLKTV